MSYYRGKVPALELSKAADEHANAVLAIEVHKQQRVLGGVHHVAQASENELFAHGLRRFGAAGRVQRRAAAAFFADPHHLNVVVLTYGVKNEH